MISGTTCVIDGKRLYTHYIFMQLQFSPKISIYLMFLLAQLESEFDVQVDDPLVLSRDVLPRGLNSFRSRLA